MNGKNPRGKRRACALAALVLMFGRAAADEVLLKDGSRIVGEVLHLDAGKLKVKTVFAKEIEVAWSEVTGLNIDRSVPFVLKSGDRLNGSAAPGPEGRLAIRVPGLAAPQEVALDSIASINPPFRPSLTFKGFVTLGGSITDGNTRTRSASATGELEARAERQRFTFRGGWNYAEDEDGLTARNARANLKHDYFFTKRFYLYAGALFEGDEFQDLRLRVALSAGPGYQFIDIGDFTQVWASELQLSGELGVSYVDEDYKNGAPDESYAAARWLVKVNWPIVPKKVVLFHVHEGFPSLERGEDLRVATEQGVRLAVLENFFLALQVNWRWDNVPAPGRNRSDTEYLFSLGYNFTVAR